MADLFPEPAGPVRVLDAGAGKGSLTVAFIARWHCRHRITVDAYELDESVTPTLRSILTDLSTEYVDANLAGGDFLEAASAMIRHNNGAHYDRAILNPPYRKISTGSPERTLIAAAGLETVNLYSGFVGLALKLMADGGHLVAIIPRSFCNGPYYRPFRDLLLENAALRRLHLFGSRTDAFSGDAVLQENVIIHVERGGVQGDVTVSTSTGSSFDDLELRSWPFAAIVDPGDEHKVIAIPTEAPKVEQADSIEGLKLSQLGVDVSTGPVVDFRMRDHLHAMPQEGDVPLIYPVHMRNDEIRWPVEGARKPNAIARNDETERWLFPSGWYVLVKRFSSKEERRRVVAAVLDPAKLPGQVVGLENHVNVLHRKRKPLPEMLARGLSTYLNSTPLDQAFRIFSGHTQVNASDLKRMTFPTAAQLEAIGQLVAAQPPVDQSEIDAIVSKGMLHA